jgi:hypothetical protein
MQRYIKFKKTVKDGDIIEKDMINVTLSGQE